MANYTELPYHDGIKWICSDDTECDIKSFADEDKTYLAIFNRPVYGYYSLQVTLIQFILSIHLNEFQSRFFNGIYVKLFYDNRKVYEKTFLIKSKLDDGCAEANNHQPVEVTFDPLEFLEIGRAHV